MIKHSMLIADHGDWSYKDVDIANKMVHPENDWPVLRDF